MNWCIGMPPPQTVLSEEQIHVICDYVLAHPYDETNKAFKAWADRFDAAVRAMGPGLFKPDAAHITDERSRRVLGVAKLLMDSKYRLERKSIDGGEYLDRLIEAKNEVISLICDNQLQRP